MLCEQQSFQVKDPFEDTVRCFPLFLLSLLISFLLVCHTLRLLRWPSFSPSFVASQPMAIGTQIYFKRDSHSQARKTIKPKNKKRNKNRLPIRVSRAHTHSLLLCFLFIYFFSFYFYFEVISMCTSISQQQHQRTAKSNQPKFLFDFFASFSALFGVVLFAAAIALRFDVSTTLAIKSNLFFVVVAVVDVVAFVVVPRFTGQKFVHPKLY